MEAVITALISSVTTLLICVLNNIFQMKKFKEAQRKITQEQTEALKYGVQALLRDRLLLEYDKWQECGYCPYDKKQNIENMFRQYEGMKLLLHYRLNSLQYQQQFFVIHLYFLFRLLF